MSETVKILRSGEDLIFAVPPAICEHLNLKEDSEVEIEPYTCSGQPGARIRPKIE